jgi:dihydroorotase
MGMPLDEVIQASTWNPAQQIPREELGHLTPGAAADIAGFRILEGRHRYRDASNGVLEGTQRLFCELTLREGRVVWDWNSVVGVDYKSLPPTYGVREGVDHVIPPSRSPTP